MNWSYWIRQTHRWLSIVFTLAVLLLSGLYMFVLPYATRWSSARRASSQRT